MTMILMSMMIGTDSNQDHRDDHDDCDRDDQLLNMSMINYVTLQFDSGCGEGETIELI